MSNAYPSLKRVFPVAARWRCLVPYCEFRSDSMTARSIEADRSNHAAEAPGHDRLVKISYALPDNVVKLLRDLRDAEAGHIRYTARRFSGYSAMTVNVALREGVVEEEAHITSTDRGFILRRTRLGVAISEGLKR